ncbi:MAG: Anhydro-N-acetylmuramic acid kinase [Anaerolineales bacterium]|nr:Anhydro-N-acetylmuramic acid kinase [Anaerolineales bacterium]
MHVSRMHVIGLMSGTSVDGIDAVLVEIEGRPPGAGDDDGIDLSLRQHVHVAYDPELRQEIFACFRPDTGTVDRVCRVNFAIGEAFAGAALEVIEAAGFTPQKVDLIGSHGQTVWHIPPAEGTPGATLQLGEGAVIAERTGITTVSNFRARDMAAGGHGAPLVSYVDWLLFSHETEARAAQNIGGIANVTFLPPRCDTPSDAFAFDTGPGNMLIDDAARRATDGEWSYDQDGQLASAGQADEELLAEWMAHPYLQRSPPKTTGREVFGAQFGAQLWAQGQARGLADVDIVATVTALTAASIARVYRDFLPPVDEIIVSGGGTQNATLMAMLRERLPSVDITPIDVWGVPAEAKEAVAFAILAYATWHHYPGTLPACTGAQHATVLGDITPGGNWVNRKTGSKYGMVQFGQNPG